MVVYLVDAEVGSHGKFFFLCGKKSPHLKIQLPDLTHAVGMPMSAQVVKLGNPAGDSFLKKKTLF